MQRQRLAEKWNDLMRRPPMNTMPPPYRAALRTAFFAGAEAIMTCIGEGVDENLDEYDEVVDGLRDEILGFIAEQQGRPS